MEVKIVLIGAGSVCFSLSLVKDLCMSKDLEGSTVCLMDINEERLEDTYLLCKKYCKEVKGNLIIEKTMDRKKSLEGADFVINTAMKGGHESIKKGWEIAFRYGYRFGGSLHIIHDEPFWVNFYQLRLMESIAVDVLDICPEAWYILVANPVMAGTTLLQRKYKKLKMLGLCHGFANIYKLIDQLGLEKEKVTYEIPGVNHMVWLNRFRYEGKDAFHLIDKWIEEESEDYFKECGICDQMGPKMVDLYKRFGVFPIGDTGNPGGGAWGYWYHDSKGTEEKWKEDPKDWYDGGLFGGSDNRLKEIKAAGRDECVKAMDVFPPEESGEPMIPLIEAIACDKKRIQIVNTLNDQQYVDGVPTDFEVEIPAVISASGVQGLKTKNLPKPIISYILRDRVAPVNMELEAYERGSKKLLLQLIMMDPWTQTEDQAKRLMDDILDMPIHTEMKYHYR